MTLQAVYATLRLGAESETDRTLLVVITTLHAQSGKPVTLAATARELLAMGIPLKRRTPRALIEAVRRLAENNLVTITEATRSPRKPLTVMPTRPTQRVAHQVRESVTPVGGVVFIRCETCGVSLARGAGANEEFEHWQKRKAAFRKRHPEAAHG